METLREAKTPIGWSVMMALSVILVGYAQSLIISLTAQPSFVDAFGFPSDGGGGNKIPASWMLAVQMCAVGSTTFGTVSVGWLTTYFSPRRLMTAALIAFLGLSFINFWAKSLGMIIVGTILQFIPCGMFATLASTYASDICPPTVSDYLTGYINVCWVLGQILTYSILWGVMDLTPWQSIHIPMAVQWIIPPLVVIGCYFAPESPVFLCRQSRFNEARSSIKRLAPPGSDDVEERLVEISELIRTEADLHIGGGYSDCFRESNRRRTEVAVMVSVGQLVCGFAIASEVVYFLQLTGLASSDSFKIAFC